MISVAHLVSPVIAVSAEARLPVVETARQSSTAA
jgi:hypothetical protein